jgi:hypothetical protein
MLLILGQLQDLVFVPESYFWENFCCVFAPEVELTHGFWVGCGSGGGEKMRF